MAPTFEWTKAFHGALSEDEVSPVMMVSRDSVTKVDGAGCEAALFPVGDKVGVGLTYVLENILIEVV